MGTSCGKLVYYLLLECPRVGRPVSKKKLAEILPPIHGKQAPSFCAYVPSDCEAPLHHLPAEVILEIAKEGKTLFPRLSCSQLQESIV